MAIFSNTPVRPNQALGTGVMDALTIEKFLGIVEGTIARESKTMPFVDWQVVRGTNKITKKGIGKASIQAFLPGEAPDGAAVQFSKNTLDVEYAILSRNLVWDLEMLQTDFDALSKIASEQGKEHAKFRDQAILIQAVKAAQLTVPPYGALPGWTAGSVETFAASGDENDPAKVSAAIANLIGKLKAKDVNPEAEGFGLFVTPALEMVLVQSDLVINGDYVTANGTKIEGGYRFKQFGIPVISTNNLPTSNITSHLLGSDFEGDFTDVAAVMFNEKALLAGETKGVELEIFRDPLSKSHYVDTVAMYSAKPDLASYAGVLLKA